MDLHLPTLPILALGGKHSILLALELDLKMLNLWIDVKDGIAALARHASLHTHVSADIAATALGGNYSSLGELELY